MEDASKKEIPKSINDVMDAIAGLGEAIGLMAEQMQGMDDRLSGQIQGLSGRTDGIEGKLARIESQMVTKDYLDRKLFELRGDLILLSRQSNTKLSTLVERLVEEGSLKRSVADRILAMEPFAQAS
ncbi:hypothetical protein KBC59_03825 [Patescibacteria group bacterium]|jgi:hypothetical protein|nr:hypothetical protein [Patescibacteria group bacterium]